MCVRCFWLNIPVKLCRDAVIKYVFERVGNIKAVGDILGNGNGHTDIRILKELADNSGLSKDEIKHSGGYEV